MVWSDGPWFEACDNDWRQGEFYKIRGVYDEHKTYGPQIDISQIRPIAEKDKTEGFDLLQFVEHTACYDIDSACTRNSGRPPRPTLAMCRCGGWC